jgi:molecular chaperone GrpE
MTPAKKSKAPRAKKNKQRDEPEAATPEEGRQEAPPAEGEDARETKERQCRELLDSLQRLAAEFSNYQKRAERRVQDGRQEAVGDLVLDLLPVIDNLERAIAAAEATPDLDAFLEGVRLLHGQLLAALKKHGITPIEADQRAFDPEHHEAVAHLPSDEHPSGHVIEEMQKGYRLGDRTLRASRVAVSSGKPEAETDEDATTDRAAAAGGEPREDTDH